MIPVHPSRPSARLPLQLPLRLAALLLVAALPAVGPGVDAAVAGHPAVPGSQGEALPLAAEWEDGPEPSNGPMNRSYVGNPLVEIRVSYRPSLLASPEQGAILLELFENWAPITVGNFINLTERGFYDDTIFHRVIDDFVIQGGDPDANDPLNDGTGEPIPLEIDANLTHVDGAIGMARESDPDTAESQYYITDGKQGGLDDENATDRDYPGQRGYAVFGVVRDGMSHVRAIACVPTSRAPLGCEYPENNADQPARPLRETDVLSIQVVGYIEPPPVEASPDTGLPATTLAAITAGAVLVVVMAGMAATAYRREPL